MKWQVNVEETKFPKVSSTTTIARPLSVEHLVENDLGSTSPNHLTLPASKFKPPQRSLSPSMSTTNLPEPPSPRRKISKDDYNFIKLLGVGAYSRVALVDKVGTGRKFAMKVMEKEFLQKV